MKLRLLHEADVDLRSLQRGDQRDEIKIAVNNLRHGTGASKEMIELAAQLGNPLAIGIMQEYFEEKPEMLSVAHYDVPDQRRELLWKLENLLGREAIADVTAECFLQAAGPDHQGRRELELAAKTVRNLDARAADTMRQRLAELSVEITNDTLRWDMPILAAYGALSGIWHGSNGSATSFIGSMGYSITVSLLSSGVDNSVPDGLFADLLMSSEKLPPPQESGSTIPSDLTGRLF